MLNVLLMGVCMYHIIESAEKLTTSFGPTSFGHFIHNHHLDATVHHLTSMSDILLIISALSLSDCANLATSRMEWLNAQSGTEQHQGNYASARIVPCLDDDAPATLFCR